MKKPSDSTLFIISGIIFLFAAIIGHDINYAFVSLGFALFTIGITKRKKEFIQKTENR